MTKLRILILHEIDSIEAVRRTSLNHAFCLIKYAPQHEYTLHSSRQPVTNRLKGQTFDLIILDTTFLRWRWAKPRSMWLDRVLADYAFVAKSDAVKIALPQDEYDHTEVLDEWLAEWKVDLIYSVCFEFADQFYKRASRHARIEPGLTGFVDDADISLALRYAKPFEARDIDVGYRAKALPAYFGRFGRMKSEIGTNFIAAMGGRSLQLDISVRAGDVFEGDAWLRFLGNCRFTIGCESGSSLLDPQGGIRSCVEAVVRQHPMATFEDIEQRCFVGLDMKHVYSAISPRLFEAALARSCQLLVPGHYMGVLQPDVHYIPLAQDLSNAEEVYEKMRDDAGNKARIEACYSALVEDDQFRYRSFVARLLSEAVSIAENKGLNLKGSGEDLMPSELDEEVRHKFMVAVVRSHHHHLEDMKEAKFMPNFLHMIAVFFARKLLSFGQRFR